MRVVVYDTAASGNQDIVTTSILVALAIMADPIKLFRPMIMACPISLRDEASFPNRPLSNLQYAFRSVTNGPEANFGRRVDRDVWIARQGDLSFVLKDTAYDLAHRFVRSYIDYDGLLCAGNATEPSQHSEMKWRPTENMKPTIQAAKWNLA